MDRASRRQRQPFLQARAASAQRPLRPRPAPARAARPPARADRRPARRRCRASAITFSAGSFEPSSRCAHASRTSSGVTRRSSTPGSSPTVARRAHASGRPARSQIQFGQHFCASRLFKDASRLLGQGQRLRGAPTAASSHRPSASATGAPVEVMPGRLHRISSCSTRPARILPPCAPRPSRPC